MCVNYLDHICKGQRVSAKFCGMKYICKHTQYLGGKIWKNSAFRKCVLHPPSHFFYKNSEFCQYIFAYVNTNTFLNTGCLQIYGILQNFWKNSKFWKSVTHQAPNFLEIFRILQIYPLVSLSSPITFCKKSEFSKYFSAP